MGLGVVDQLAIAEAGLERRADLRGRGTASNWSNPPVGAPPIFPTQSIIFGSTGSETVTVGAGPMLQDSWTFLANSQSCKGQSS
jgi:hypothetical protein